MSARNAASSDSRLRLLFQLRRRALGHDASVVHDGDAMGDAVRLIHVVRGEKDRGLLGFVEALDVGPELVAALRVEPQRRLIEKQNLRRVQKAARDLQPPLHARRRRSSRTRPCAPTARRASAVPRCAAARILRGHVVEHAVQVHVFVGGLLAVQAGVLKDDAEALAGLLLLHGRIKAVQFDAAAGGAQQRGEHLDGGGFAGAVGTEKGEYLSLRDVEADVLDGSEIAEVL